MGIDLLLVDDDDDLRADMRSFFQRRGFSVDDVNCGEEAIKMVERRAYDVMILDMAMPGLTGLDLLRQIKARESEMAVVMLTGQGTIESAVEAMKLGAREFVTKPVRLKDLDQLVEKALLAGRLERENRQLKAALRHGQRPTNIIGQSDAMLEVFRLIERVGPTDKPVLIQGESGTGKELVARALHESSLVADRPFVTINCAALPESLLESELFGHEKGAFTGAVNSKPGLFEVADGGTLFVDEIGELAGPLQAKLLRVLEDGSLRRIGSVKERRVHVRLVAATNRDMEEEVHEGRFREDLFYRINVLQITLPPLRERRGDLRLLIEHFVGDEWHLEEGLLKVLERYSWPGNVRQLQNAVERARILSDDEWIRLENLPPEIARSVAESPLVQTGSDCDLDTLNKIHIEETYRRHDRNKARTARALGIGRRTLYRLLEKHGIDAGGIDESARTP